MNEVFTINETSEDRLACDTDAYFLRHICLHVQEKLYDNHTDQEPPDPHRGIRNLFAWGVYIYT